MNSPTTYRVVAVRANGGESIVAHHLPLEAAQRVVRMIRLGSPLQEIRIESEQDGPVERNRGMDEPYVKPPSPDADATSESN